MRTGIGEVQTIVLFGGTSDIGRAIVDRLRSAAVRTIVLAVRDPDSVTGDDVERWRTAGVDVVVERFDALDTSDHAALVERVAAAHGDIDVAIVAFGLLGDAATVHRDPAAAAELAAVNYTGAVSILTATATHLRAQGHGSIVVLSSVAGERVRKSNYLYGSTKAGIDGFAQGLGDSLAGTGVSVMIVRPGFVHTKMTTGVDAAPFATTPDAVAEATVAGLRKGARIVWVPGILRAVFTVFRHLPSPIWRRIER